LDYIKHAIKSILLLLIHPASHPSSKSEVMHIRWGGRETHADHQPSFTKCLSAANQNCRCTGKPCHQTEFM